MLQLSGALRSTLLFPLFPLPRAQVAEPVDGQTAGVLRFMFRNCLDMPRKATLRRQIKVMPGHGTVNVDRPSERLCKV